MGRMHGAVKWVLPAAFLGMLVVAGCGEATKSGEAEKEKIAPPKVDGVLDDAIWKTVEPLSVAKLNFGDDVPSKTRVFVAHDAENLYLAAECSDDPATLKNLVADTADHDTDGIWRDDCIEFFIDPTGKRESYYQFIVNSKGVTWDVFHVQPGKWETGWEPKYEIKTAVGETSWNVEMAVPLAAFDRTKEHAATWVFNASRTRVKADEVTFWKATMEDGSHVPKNFGVLENMPAKTATP